MVFDYCLNSKGKRRLAFSEVLSTEFLRPPAPSVIVDDDDDDDDDDGFEPSLTPATNSLSMRHSTATPADFHRAFARHSKPTMPRDARVLPPPP